MAKRNDGFASVEAFTPPGESSGSYLRAMTGDYDLWGVFATAAAAKQVPGDYVRDEFSKPLDYARYQDAKKRYEALRKEGRWKSAIAPTPFNNSTPFVDKVVNRLNGVMRYPGGNLVNHGDEIGCHGIDKPSLPFIAFFPCMHWLGVEDPWIVSTAPRWKSSLMNCTSEATT